MNADLDVPAAEVAASAVQQHQQEQQQAQQHEQKTAQQAPTRLHTEIGIEIKVKNITRHSLDVLEKAYTQWAAWQHHTYQQGYSPEEQLFSGSLSLDVTELSSSGRVIWQDTIAHVPGTGKPPAMGAAAYEQTEAPPLYDRGSDELLAPPAVLGSGISMLPGGAEASRRRQMAEARLSLDECADAAGVLPAKRKRLPNNRCFNCGSYAHGVAQCPKEFDAARVNAAKAERGAFGGGNTGIAALMRQRYFQGAGKNSSNKPGPFEGIKPGCITADLAAAVGMHSQAAPPPWLSRMAALGLPPKWMSDAPAAGLTEEDIFAFVNGSEDEADAPAGTAAEQDTSSDESSGPVDSADADFVPIGDVLEQQGEAAEQDTSSEQQQQRTASGSKQDTAAVIQSNGRTGVNGGLAAAAPAAAAAAVGENGSVSGKPLAHFPGINGPLPDGADAEQWQAELDKGFSLRHMLTVS